MQSGCPEQGREPGPGITLRNSPSRLCFLRLVPLPPDIAPPGGDQTLAYEPGDSSYLSQLQYILAESGSIVGGGRRVLVSTGSIVNHL